MELPCINLSLAALWKEGDNSTARQPVVLRKSCHCERSEAIARRALKRTALCLFLVILASLNACTLISSPVKRKYIQYPISKGDTLYTISQRFDVEVGEITRVNNISDPRALRVGQIIKVPYHGQSPGKAGATGNGAKEASEIKPHSGSLKRIKLSRAATYIGKMVWPVGSGGGRLTSQFGWRWLNFHEGIDISGSEGTPIYAAHSGRIAYSGTKISGYGKIIVLQGDGLVSVYAHNRNNRVKTGEAVERGERIADLGMSGKATGPHLHFETRIKNDDGKYAAIDPLVFFQKLK